MQYEGFNLQITEDGCIVRNSKGDFIFMADTEDEAYEYVDKLNNKETKLPPTNYDRFVKYCNRLPGKFFIDSNKLATTNERALKKLIMSFEKVSDLKVFTSMNLIDGEYIFIVDRVE